MSGTKPVRAFWGLAIGMTLFTPSMFAQKAGGGPVRPPTTNGTSPIGTLPTNSTNPNLGRDSDRGNLPLFFSGKVLLDDGTLPSEPVPIEMICGGARRSMQSRTDMKGHFTFQLGHSLEVSTDASMSDAGTDSNRGINGISQNSPIGALRSGQTNTNTPSSMLGCELRASMPGFRSDSVSLANHRALDNPDVGTIVLHRMSAVEGLTISATTALAPKDARKAFEKALEAEKKGKLGEAGKDYQKAADLYPKFAAAWTGLGRLQEANQDVAEARKAYAAALAADPKYVPPYERLAAIASRETKWQEVADTTERIIRLNPFDYPQAYLLNGQANFNLGKLGPAEKSTLEALKLDAGHRNPQIEHLLGVILSKKGDLAGAAEHMKAYLLAVPGATDASAVRRELAEIEKVLDPRAENQKP